MPRLQGSRWNLWLLSSIIDSKLMGISRNWWLGKNTTLRRAIWMSVVRSKWWRLILNFKGKLNSLPIQYMGLLTEELIMWQASLPLTQINFCKVLFRSKIPAWNSKAKQLCLKRAKKTSSQWKPPTSKATTPATADKTAPNGKKSKSTVPNKANNNLVNTRLQPPTR